MIAVTILTMIADTIIPNFGSLASIRYRAVPTVVTVVPETVSWEDLSYTVVTDGVDFIHPVVTGAWRRPQKRNLTCR